MVKFQTTTKTCLVECPSWTVVRLNIFLASETIQMNDKEKCKVSQTMSFGHFDFFMSMGIDVLVGLRMMKMLLVLMMMIF